MRNVFERLNLDGYRYSIKVPITEDEKSLFEDNVTDIEFLADEIIRSLVVGGLSMGYSGFIKKGYLPVEFIKDKNELIRGNYNQVIKNLKKRGYLNGAAQRIQCIGERKFCFKMDRKLKMEIKNAQFEKC